MARCRVPLGAARPLPPVLLAIILLALAKDAAARVRPDRTLHALLEDVSSGELSGRQLLQATTQACNTGGYVCPPCPDVTSASDTNSLLVGLQRSRACQQLISLTPGTTYTFTNTSGLRIPDGQDITLLCKGARLEFLNTQPLIGTNSNFQLRDCISVSPSVFLDSDSDIPPWAPNSNQAAPGEVLYSESVFWPYLSSNSKVTFLEGTIRMSCGELRLLQAWVPLLASLGFSDVRVVTPEPPLLNMGLTWGVAMSGREIDRTQSIYYYNRTLVACDPSEGPNTPAPSLQSIIQAAEELARAQQNAGVPGGPLMPAPAGPGGGTGAGAGTCLSSNPVLAQVTADSAAQLQRLAVLPEPCLMEVTLTGPSRYSLQQEQPIIIPPDKAVIVTCGNRTLDLLSQRGPSLVLPGGSMTLENCILENMGSGAPVVPQVVQPYEMIKPPAVSVMGGYYKLTTPEWCKTLGTLVLQPGVTLADGFEIDPSIPVTSLRRAHVSELIWQVDIAGADAFVRFANVILYCAASEDELAALEATVGSGGSGITQDELFTGLKRVGLESNLTPSQGHGDGVPELKVWGTISLTDSRWTNALIPMMGAVRIIGYDSLNTDVPPIPVELADPAFGIGAAPSSNSDPHTTRALLNMRRQRDILYLRDDPSGERACLKLENLDLVNLPLGPNLDLVSFTPDALSSHLWFASMAPENQPAERGSIELTNVTMYIECDEVRALNAYLTDKEGEVTMPEVQTTDGIITTLVFSEYLVHGSFGTDVIVTCEGQVISLLAPLPFERNLDITSAYDHENSPDGLADWMIGLIAAAAIVCLLCCCAGAYAGRRTKRMKMNEDENLPQSGKAASDPAEFTTFFSPLDQGRDGPDSQGEPTRVLKLATGTSSSGDSINGAPQDPHSTRSFDDAASSNSASHSRSEMEGNIETATRKLQRDLCAQQLHIERPIGKGGFGTVYKGTWRSLPVAIKTMLYESERASSKAKRIIAEAAIAYNLHHPNIIVTYAHEIKQIGGDTNTREASVWKLYLVQEYCNGGTLREYIDGGGLDPLMVVPAIARWTQILRVLSALAEGMVYLHSQSIVHGDLNPSNVLFKLHGVAGAAHDARSAEASASCTSEGGQTSADGASLLGSETPKLNADLADALCNVPAQCDVKITDFGLSSRLEDLKTHISGVNHGTPFYTSPEMIERNQLHKGSDVYAYGVIMWELVSGMAPYVAKTSGPVPTQANTWFEAHPEIDDFSVEVPLTYTLLAKACSSKEPYDRPSFELVQKVLNDLKQEIAQGQYINSAGQLQASIHLGRVTSSTVGRNRPRPTSQPLSASSLRESSPEYVQARTAFLQMLQASHPSPAPVRPPSERVYHVPRSITTPIVESDAEAAGMDTGEMDTADMLSAEMVTADVAEMVTADMAEMVTADMDLASEAEGYESPETNLAPHELHHHPRSPQLWDRVNRD